MDSLPTELFRLVISEIIPYGKFRIKASMGKEIILGFNKELTVAKKEKVILR